MPFWKMLESKIFTYLGVHGKFNNLHENKMTNVHSFIKITHINL